MSKPRVTIGLTTWAPDDKPERLVYLRRTLEALEANLWVAGCDMAFVLGAETKGVGKEATAETLRLAKEFGWLLHWHNDKPMLARNLENIWRAHGRKYYFNMQDDWLLHTWLQLAEEIRFLEAHPSLGVIRYRWRDKGWNMGKRVGNHTFLDPKRAKKGYFGHSPYLAQRSALEELQPLAEKEMGVSDAALHASFKVAVHHPSMFYHIGEKTTIHGNRYQPVDCLDSWKPRDGKRNTK